MRSHRLAFALMLAVACFSSSGFAQNGQSGQETGDAAIAARYAGWAINAAEEGRWTDAEVALERAADFSDASSDISYLLALARLKLDRPAGAALGAVRRALEADRWDRYGREAALLVEAGILVRLRLFDEALDALAPVGEGPERAYLRTAALSFAHDAPHFRYWLRDALDAYPGDPRFARLLFDYAYGRVPEDGDRVLVDLVLSRLPYLIKLDPSLAYRASPFIRDIEERRRLVAAYRAASSPDLASLPQALELGLVDEAVATTELFAADSIDAVIFREVWALLRSDEARQAFAVEAGVYDGELTEDIDRDGYAESTAHYRKGQIVACAFDVDQDGLSELDIEFADGLPVRCRVAASADASPKDEVSTSDDISSADSERLARLPSKLASEEDRRRASVDWERYPFVASVSYDGVRYIPAPAAFPFAPIRLVPIVGGKVSPPLRFPKNDPSVSRLTVRSLVSFASVAERPGIFFKDAVERIELVRGVPRRSTETVDGRVVSILEFSSGRPSLRKVDSDFDGRMETVRYYKTSTYAMEAPSTLDWEEPVELIESDWDGDGMAEYAERHFSDGSIERSWDMDGDGKRERAERSTAASEEVHATQ